MHAIRSAQRRLLLGPSSHVLRARISSSTITSTRLARSLVTRSDHRTSPPVQRDDRPLHLYEENYAEPTRHTLSVFRRLFTYTLRGVLAIGILTALGYEGAHAWVERVELAAESAPEGGWCDWDLERESWTGENGGTDSSLGWKARHAIRTAWMSLNWTSSVAGGNTVASRIHPDINEALKHDPNSASLAFKALSVALDEAQKRSASPRTIRDLTSRRAAVLEKLGSEACLRRAVSDWREVFESLKAESVSGNTAMTIQAARVAVKLGDIYSRLGLGQRAVRWWTSGIQLAGGGSLGSIALQDESSIKFTERLLRVDSKHGLLSFVSDASPAPSVDSPLAQRTIASALLSLSVHYSTTNQLPKAVAVQLSALGFLSRLVPSSPPSAPPQNLHALFLQHRLSLITLHMAEVIYALSKTHESALPLALITASSEQTEKVSQILVGLPMDPPDAPQSRVLITPSPTKPLDTSFTNRTLRTPATRLLRDARRTVVESWNSRGLLIEGNKGREAEAMDCFERALQWAGREGGIEKGRGENTLQDEWMKVWTNYVRVRENIQKR